MPFQSLYVHDMLPKDIWENEIEIINLHRIFGSGIHWNFRLNLNNSYIFQKFW